MNRKTKVLCFTDDAVGRDVEMLLPIRYFAERFLNCEFYHALNIDIHQIYRIKPDVILQANTIGSNLYFEISKIAHQQNIPVFALISEGNFRTDGSFDYWGFNRDKKFYQDYVCCWSERTAEFLKKEVPEAANKIVVTGGVGFDRYTIYKFMHKDEFLNKYNKKQYKKVIGYAGWAFGKLEYPRGNRELLSFFKGDNSRLVWAEEQRQKIRDILRDAIIKNKDTLFILRQHPHEPAPERPQASKNEMNELKDYENVIYLCSEESIHDLISVSDLWTCFESTTALEGWLMKKQVIFINPDPDFHREQLYRGSVLINSYEEFQKAIDDFYLTGKIENFFVPEKILLRNKLISDIIGFGDGMNHVRASYYFKKTIDNSNRPNINRQYNFHVWHFIVYVLIRIAGPLYNRVVYSKLWKFKKHLWVFENYKMNKIHTLYKKYVSFWSAFYEHNRVEENFSSGKLN